MADQEKPLVSFGYAPRLQPPRHFRLPGPRQHHHHQQTYQPQRGHHHASQGGHRPDGHWVDHRGSERGGRGGRWQQQRSGRDDWRGRHLSPHQQKQRFSTPSPDAGGELYKPSFVEDPWAALEGSALDAGAVVRAAAGSREEWYLPSFVEDPWQALEASPRGAHYPHHPLAALVRKQLSWYFGDINWPRDEFLRAIAAQHEGWVPIASLLGNSFKRLTVLTTDPQIVLEAVGSHPDIVINADRTALRKSST